MIGGDCNILNSSNNTRMEMEMEMEMEMKMNLPILSVLLILLFHNQLLLPCSSLNTEGMALLKFRERVKRDPMNALSNWSSKDGVLDHCSWFGVSCSDDGFVLVLNLKNLCLGGTLAPELGQLSYIKSILLRNNSFTGVIPTEIADLGELEVLDLGYNHFSGPLPATLGNNFSLSILLLDNNNLLGSLSPELNQLQLQSEHQVDENQLRGVSDGIRCNSEPLSWYDVQQKDSLRRNLLKVQLPSHLINEGNTKTEPVSRAHSHVSQSPASAPSHSHSHKSPSPSPSHVRSHPHPPSHKPSPRHSTRFPSPLPSPVSAPSPSPSRSFHLPSHTPTRPVHHSLPPNNPPVVALSPGSAQAARVPASSSSSSKTPDGSSSKHHKVIIWAPVAGAFGFLIIGASAVLFCRSCKVVTVKPWATGLSGQLQRAFVSGVPQLKRSELELACEDFSNVIGSLADGTVYKGTLSTGVEIAVVASSVKSPDEWSNNLELQFRKKIETLSRVNHKNFVNLIGYCEEETPFTRVMVFEYAPNGTLFEHLHIKEAERLDWRMRLRIVMGMAYCLEHMHQLDPPISHRDMQSSSIYLSEDYAAKVSDFSFWTEGARSKMRSPSLQLFEASSTDTESNVFNFGLVLFEVITGRIPYMEDECSVADWVFELLEKDHIPQEIIDPTLSSFEEEELQRLFYIIRDCVNPDRRERPTIGEVAARLREITGISPEGATPKLSPLWWAELEVLSTEM